MDRSSDWVPLKDLKALNAIELAKYVVANNIAHKPASKWWVKTTLWTKDCIKGKIKSKYWHIAHKFGICVPKTVEEAYELDRQTGTDFWRKAIKRELSKVRVAFKKLSVTPEEMRNNQVQHGYQEIKCHWVFDIKMDGNLTHKARLVTGGHMTEAPSSLTYSSVVSRDSVHLAFLIVALNDLEILCTDVGNAYLNAPCKEKIWTVLVGIEFFGSEAGLTMIIVRALYRLKTSGASWAAMLAESLSAMGYQPTEAYKNVWIKPSVKQAKWFQVLPNDLSVCR
jgi:Reverse transcriptase (RNA-dependent DNA polymerase).